MYRKRMYGFSRFAEDFSGFVTGLPGLVGAFRSGRVSPGFREKIMLAVTGVNDCRYCRFVHSTWAKAHKVDPCEIEAILGREFNGRIKKNETVALQFAAHYTETEKKPSTEMLDKLNETYGTETARDILKFLDMIYLANLTGNTFDAFLARLRGERAEGSSLLFEAALSAVVWPVLLPQNAIINLRRALGKDVVECSD
jgi:AhpD family alkylhydroperoxidase